MEISSIQPIPVWSNFAKINAIPRPSKKEERIIEFMMNFGNDLGLETIQDEVGNVIIKKPASPNMEDRQTVVLQSHLDMVCQKNNDTVFDFDTEGIKMYVDGDWVRAKGTTLGADNGLGVATIMALLESKDIAHPALEALFTIDEETGMTGAMGLKPGMLTGAIMLNLDTEEDDEITIGCAGGVDVTGTQKYEVEAVEGALVTIHIKGLQGGHSGGDIHKGWGNANVMLGRLLFEAINFDAQLCSIDSGGLRNAIPREGSVTLKVNDAKTYIEQATQLKNEILKEYENLEKDLEIELTVADSKSNAISVAASTRIIMVLKALHNGVYRMSPDIADLVEASNNIARVALNDGDLKILCLTRSSVASTKYQLADQLTSVLRLAGIEVAYSGEYPGWKPNPKAEIISTMTQIYKGIFSSDPHVMACHAGLECGIIGANYPEMEMVSFGPTIRGAHSPDERASISSTQKFWKYLLAILKDFPKK